MKNFFFILTCGIGFYTFAQVNDSVAAIKELKPLKGNTTNDSVTVFKTKINDYKFWYNNSPVSIIDTTLSIQNYYNQNFTKQDFFGKMSFPNIGSVVVELEKTDKPFVQSMLPFGIKYNYYDANQIKYYNVKTPYTEFIYEAGVKQGNFLSTTFSQNLSPQFNYTLHYRGLNSEGRFYRDGNKNNSFILSSNYNTKNNRFKLQWHWATQRFENQQNGGIQDIDDFIYQKDRRLTNVRNINVNLQNASSEFDSRRIYLQGTYGIIKKINPVDSTESYPIILKNELSYEKQKFRFEQGSAQFYDFPLVSSTLKDKKSATNFSNVTTAGFQWTDKLKAEAGIKVTNLSVFVDNLYNPTESIVGFTQIPKKWSENLFGVVGKFDFDWNDKIKLHANAELLQGKDYSGLYNLDAVLDVTPINGYTLSAGILAQSNIPSLNLMYNQSYYANFNYFNLFSKENTQNIYGKLSFDKINTSIEASLYNIDNYVYVDYDYKPQQLNDNINYFKIKLYNHFKFYNHFNLVSTIQYQNVTKNEDYMPLPDLILRETLYWQGGVFSNKAQLQAGINAYYFTKYNAFSYFPVINEMQMQKPDAVQKIGNYPLIDLFLNFKVQNMRFYIRGEHINALFSKEPDYFSAPGVPFRGFKIQLGLKWNIFT